MRSRLSYSECTPGRRKLAGTLFQSTARTVYIRREIPGLVALENAATGKYLATLLQWLSDAEGAKDSDGVSGDPLSGEDPVGLPGGM